jgi:hypothetical protein
MTFTNVTEFYARRDHRTNMYSGIKPAYTSKRVLMTGDETALRTYAGQVAACVSANLLSRWCRGVDVAIGDIELHPLLGPGRLVDKILQQMRSADPFGLFASAGFDAVSDLRLHIGSDAPLADQAPLTTILSCNGWFAAVRRPGDAGLNFADDDFNPVGAATAAVLAGAQVFRDSLGLGEMYQSGFTFDAFSAMPTTSVSARPAYPSEFDVGKVMMLGAGAVGSSAAFFMDLFGLRADLTCADADEVKVENLGRTPLFVVTDCGQNKAHALAHALEGSSLRVVPLPAWWHDLSSNDLRLFDIVLPLANEHHVRTGIQRALPPLMIHASTGGNWLVNFGRHIPGRDDCLAERFAGFDRPLQLACSGGEVPVAPGQSIDASLPFLSFWAGLLVATDMVRLAVEGYPHVANFGMYSFRKSFAAQLLPRYSRDNCDCRTTGSAFAKLRGEGRYRRLSPDTW